MKYGQRPNHRGGSWRRGIDRGGKRKTKKRAAHNFENGLFHSR